jgi:hypothetical protein
VEVETMGHVLWSYLAAKGIWSWCGSKIQKRSIENAKLVFILEELFQYLGKEDIELMAVVARMFWFCRNTCVYGKKVSPPYSVIGCAAKSLEAFQLANSRKDGSMERVITDDFIWKALKNGFIKINWHVAMDNS